MEILSFRKLSLRKISVQQPRKRSNNQKWNKRGIFKREKMKWRKNWKNMGCQFQARKSKVNGSQYMALHRIRALTKMALIRIKALIKMALTRIKVSTRTRVPSIIRVRRMAHRWNQCRFNLKGWCHKLCRVWWRLKGGWYLCNPCKKWFQYNRYTLEHNYLAELISLHIDP